MPLKQDGDIIRMTECPFCGADLEGKPVAPHLEDCEDFYRECGVEPPSTTPRSRFTAPRDVDDRRQPGEQDGSDAMEGQSDA